MSSLFPPTAGRLAGPAPAVPPPRAGIATRRRTARAGAVLLLLLLAVLLRAWNIGAIFASSDQVAAAYLVRHSFGIKWLFAHDYGPVLAVLQRSFAEVLSRLHLPIAEASARVPVMIVSVAQVVITLPLLRRFRCPRSDALVGALCCAVLPTLVTDGHYAWGYLTIWLFTGSLALWATLAWFDDRRPWQLVTAACALLAHCLSNCYAFALPLTLAVAWVAALRNRRQGDPGRPARPAIRWAVIGFLLPCLAALTVIYLSWRWTDGGQLGRLIAKHRGGTTRWQAGQFAEWARAWIGQFGYLFGAVAGLGMIFGGLLIARRDRRGLLAIWAWAGALPLVFFVTPWTVGYPGSYLIEAIYGAGLLGTLLICSTCRRLAAHSRARAGVAAAGVLALCHMGIGGADDCLAGGRLARYTGVHTGWGNVQPDTGIKAASWYVRQHVPMDATVMALHTNRGMEAPVAEYYIGRNVLAGYDLKSGMLKPLVQKMHGIVDVLIVSAEHQALVEALDDFERVCTLTNRGRPVRFVYARRALSLARLQEETAAINTRYDRQFQPRHVPICLPAPAGFGDKLRRFQERVRQLRPM